jgi:type VI secretion system protein VasD
MYRLLPIIVAFFIAGCAAPPPAQHISLELEISVSADANPDDAGRPSPVVLSVFDLLQTHSFRRAAYLDLLRNPQKLLKENLLGQQRTTAIAPGQHRTLTLMLEPQALHAGIVAELVQFAAVKTRTTAALKPAAKNRLQLVVNARGIALQQADKPTAYQRFNDD